MLSGVEQGDILIEFAEAVMEPDETRLEKARNTLLEQMGPAATVATAAIIATFNQMDRIADATGISIDEMALEMTAPVREALRIDHFNSAGNTISAT